MPFLSSPTDLLTALSAPLGDVISAVGASVADAQAAMDAQTIENLRTIASEEGDLLAALRSIGYQPTWYQIPEVTAEISVALTVAGEAATASATSSTAVASSALELRAVRLMAAPIDASYTNKFSYDLKAATQVKFRIVPVPPTPAAEALRVAPDVVGQTFADARALLETLDVPFTFEDGADEPVDEALVTGQTPAAGTVLSAGESVVLAFS